MEGIQFTIGEASPAQGEALALATKQAMAKAEAAAAALNGRIVRVLQTVEGSVPQQMMDPEYIGVANASASSMMDRKPLPLTPVRAGTLDVRSQVILVVEVSI